MVMFSFAGCGDELPRSDNLPDFANCKVGYKLKVYPDFPFDYEMKDGTIIHIEKIEATLTAKNTIKKGETIKGSFYPYEVTIRVIGSTDKVHTGKTLILHFSNVTSYVGCDIDTDGHIIGEAVFKWISQNQPLFFLFIE